MYFDDPDKLQSITDTKAGGEPATFAERTAATFSKTRVDSNGMREWVALANAYDERIKEIKDAGLGDLSNIHPMRKQWTLNPVSDGVVLADGSVPEPPETVFQKKLEELAQKNPDKAWAIKADRPVDARDEYWRRANRAEQAERNYGGPPLTGPIADFIGGMGAQAVDPLSAPTIFMGPMSRVAPGARSILAMGAKQAAANMMVEAGFQPFIQQWRKEMGDTYGWWESAKDIGIAGVFGFGVDAGVRTVFRGGQWLAGRKPIIDADGTVKGYESGAKAAERAEGVAAQDRTNQIVSAYEARNLEIQKNLEALPKDTFDRIAQGDDEATIAFIKAVKADEDPSMAGAINALRNTDRVTLDGIDDGWRERSLIQQLRALEDPSEPTPVHFDAATKAERPRLADDAELPRGTEGNQHYRMLDLDGKPVRFEAIDANRITTDPATFQFKGGRDAAGASNALRAVDFDGRYKGKVIVYEREDGSLVVADGHDRVSLANRAPEPQKLDALVFREKDGWTAEQVRAEAARKNIQEGTGSLMDVAGAIRRHPEIVDDSMAVSTDFMADARSIARLSDEAFDAVAAGQFDPKHGVLVSDHVPDQSRHMEVLRELDRRNPPTEAAARREIGNMLREPANMETLTRVMDIPLAEPHVLEARNDVLAGVMTTLRQEPGYIGEIETQAIAAVIRRLAEKPGLVSDVLAQAGRAVAEGQPLERAIDATLRRFEDVIGKAGVKGLADQPVRLSPDERPRFLAALSGSDASRLDMSPEARKARAEQMGFDTGKVWYHGTKARFDAFDLSAGGRVTDAPSARMAIFFSNKPNIAETYAFQGKSPRLEKLQSDAEGKVRAIEQRTEQVDAELNALLEKRDTMKEADFVSAWKDALSRKPSVEELMAARFDAVTARSNAVGSKESMNEAAVIPSYARVKNPFIKDYGGAEFRDQSFADVLASAQSAGHDAVIFRNVYDAWKMYGGKEYTGDILAIFDPTNIRSVNATFDPAEAGSARLLAALSGSDAAVGRSMRADLDRLGYYSKALEAAKSLKQPKGTPEQMLAQLKAAGVKDAEIEATNLRSFLDGKTSITRDEIVKHLTENRVGVNEKQYAGEAGYNSNQSIGRELLNRAEHYQEPDRSEMISTARRMMDDTEDRLEPSEFSDYGSVNDEIQEIIESTPKRGKGVSGPAKWSSHSLDPSNPTYRETVLHLPERGEGFEELDAALNKLKVERDEIESRIGPDVSNASKADMDAYDGIIARIEQRREALRQNKQETFRSGHFSEPNIIGHMMTSLNKHEGKPVFTLDQIQSDWGQKLRDGGVRDEAKIAELKAKIAAENKRSDALADPLAAELDALGVEPYSTGRSTTDVFMRTTRFKNELREAERRGDSAKIGELIGAADRVDAIRREYDNLRETYSLLEAELRTAEQAASGHPLVNTTDQWTNTTLRRALRQAVEADAEFIAIPHGDTVLSYNPGDEAGMRGFYGSHTSEGIVPKNLRKLLEKIDKDAAKPTKVETLEATDGPRGWKKNGETNFDKSQTGFTLFPLTDKVKKSILEEGQPLFAKPAENITPTKLNEFAENLRQALDEATTPPPGRLDDPIKDAPKQVERLREDLAEDIAAVMPPKLAAAEMPKAAPSNGIPSLVDLYQRYSTQGREALDAVMPGTGRMIDEFVQANPEVVARIAEALGAPTGRPQAAQMLEQAMPQFMSPRIIDMSKPVLLTPEANARMREIRTAIDETVKMLPPEYRIRVEDSLVFNFGDGDKRLDGLHDGYEKLIYVSMAAGDPVRTSRHEVIHALRQTGLMKDEEFSALYKFADRLGLRKAYEIDAQYKDPYTQAYGNRGADFVEQLLREETVANMFSDYSLNGRRFGDVAGGGMVDRLIDMIVTFMKQVRDIMGGYGFRNVYDVFESIESGAMARRGMGDAPEASRLAMFAGENAKTADLDALAKAKQMDAEGKPREAIWTDTGWFKGVDGKWRFEISDHKANLDLKGAISDGWEPNQRWPADHLFNHQELFAAYPAMRETGIQYRPFPANLNDAAAAFGQRGNLVSLNSGYRDFANERTMQSFGLHELQHVVQSIEEMARGGNSSKFTKEMLEAERARIAAEQAARPKLDDWTAVDNSIAPADMTDVDLGRSLYRRLAGEAEARLVQKRMNMTPEERRARPPWLDYDVPEADQIVRMANEAIQMSLEDKPLARDLADVQRDRDAADLVGACRA